MVSILCLHLFSQALRKKCYSVLKGKTRGKIKKISSKVAKTQSFRKEAASMPNRFLNESQTARICHSRESGNPLGIESILRRTKLALARMKLSMDFLQISAIEMRVNLRRRQTGVAEHFLDGAQVRTSFKQMCGERMPKSVR